MAKVGGVRTAVLAGSLVGALTLSACGSGSSGGSKASSPSGSTQASQNLKPVKQLWLYTGPEHDVGYNLGQTAIMRAVDSIPSVSTAGELNHPYSVQS